MYDHLEIRTHALLKVSEKVEESGQVLMYDWLGEAIVCKTCFTFRADDMKLKKARAQSVNSWPSEISPLSVLTTDAEWAASRLPTGVAVEICIEHPCKAAILVEQDG